MLAKLAGVNRPCSFSATLEGDAIQDFAERLLEDRWKFLPIPPPVSAKKFISGITAPMILRHKTALLVHLLKQPEATRSIVFVRKRERVHELANWLREAGINNCYLEGEMVQGKRNEAIKRLTEGRVTYWLPPMLPRAVSTFLTSATSLTSICRAVAILICTVSDVPRAPVVKAPQFRWWKPMTICCWAKLVAILKSQLKLA
ncbi:ATP-dependent RNA helicase [Escherichia coli]|uniref:ATP-dependent RNA helicase n=1 Tax=Escherichia coli TaxID=562 RepID=A0A377BVT8_ECOLX|nr:ATP-dependent RNA helicase [Escherichia coli]